MQWLGLAPSTLLAIFAATATALVALHLVRRQRRETIVPFLELFVRDKSEARSLTFLSRRLLWFSLLLLLAIAGLLVAATGDPRPREGRATGRDVVIAIDVSRSMGTIEHGRSRLELAKDEARRVVRALGSFDRATIVAFGTDPETRSPLTDDRGSLLDGIGSLEVEDVHDDLPRAVAFANEILAGKKHPTLVLLGDAATIAPEAFARLDRRVDVRTSTFGGSRENLGIVAFAARRYRRDRSQAEVRVVLRNSGATERTAELVLESDGRPLDVRRVALAPGETKEESLRHLGGAEATFVARLRATDGKADALPTDDVAYATLPPRRALRVQVVSENDLYLEAATWLDETVEPTVVAPSAYRDSTGFDLVLFDATLPTSRPTVPAIYFAPRPSPGRFSPFTTRRDLLAPSVTRVARDDSLMRSLDLDDVAIARALDVVVDRSDTVLVQSRSSALVVRGAREGHRFLSVNFDLRESDFPLRMAFPVFVVRAIEELVGDDAEFEEGFRTDSVARIPVRSTSPRVRVVDPRGRESDAIVLEGKAVFRPRHVGLYRIRDDDGERLVAAGLGPSDETSIASHAYERDGRAIASRTLRGSGRSGRPWAWLVGLAALLLTLEWLTHHKRWTA